jgi:glycosyltransferase involved in cell wall biosynthesis
VKLIVHTNAPWAPTGYGQQCAQLIPQLADAGHQVAVSAFYGAQGATLAWQDGRGRSYPVYGCHLHAYGDDIILGHATHHFGGDVRDGWILMLIDVWVYNAAQFTRTNTACWVPVDHDPVPPRVIEFFQVSGAVPIAMSRFGEDRLRAAGLDPLYVPHGIDTQVFQPHDQQEARVLCGLPQDRFIVGMVAANKGNSPSRKGFSQALEAFARLRARHEDAIMYIHTELTGVVNGVNLPALMGALGLPADSVAFCDQYRYATGGYPPEYMANAYSAMDVLLNPALGEGFGIPVVEAQACGTPVIVTDWTAMSELCGSGWRVGGDRYFTDQGAFWKLPSVDGIELALGEAYEARGTDRAVQMGAAARTFALQYDSTRVFENHWQPVLAELESKMGALAEPADLIEVA